MLLCPKTLINIWQSFEYIWMEVILSHINRPLRKIGHLTVPRCLAEGGGIALICVDTYTYFTAVQNILLIGGWICFNSAVSHGLPSCVLVFSCLTSRTLLIFLAIETFRIFYTFSSSISTFSSSFSTFSSSFLTLSSSWFLTFSLKSSYSTFSSGISCSALLVGLADSLILTSTSSTGIGS